MGEKHKCDIDTVIDELDMNYETAAELYSSYIEEMTAQIELAFQLLYQNSWEKLERVIHNIKGVSANLKINDVYDKAVEFDILLKKGDNKNSEDYMKSINLLIEQAIYQIKEYFKSHGVIIP